MGAIEVQNCADCGGFDIEWMYKCHKHGAEYCRGCSCPYCVEDDCELDEYDLTGAGDLDL